MKVPEPGSTEVSAQVPARRSAQASGQVPVQKSVQASARVPALIETLAVDADGPRHLEAHLDRLATSTAALGHQVDIGAVRAALAAERLTACDGHVVVAADGGTTLAGEGPPGAASLGGPGTALGTGICVVRVEVSVDGEFALSRRQLPTDDGAPVRLAVDSVPFDPAETITRHKVAARDRFGAARARCPGADDVVLVTTAGRVAETTIANLAVRLDGAWWTPPLADGALPGIGRRLALAQGHLAERSIGIDELRAAEQIAVVSSVRGWRRAELIGTGPHR